MSFIKRRVGPLAGLLSLVLTGVVLPAPSASKAVEGRVIALQHAAPGSVMRLRMPIEASMVGFDWDGRREGTVRVRALTPSGWSPWFESEGELEDGPDLSSPEYRARTSSNPVWLGEGVRDIEVRAGDLPGLRLHVVHADLGWRAPAISPAAADVPQPAIISRAAWGADESWRNCGPNYSDRVRYAIVHHTVTGNTYSQDEAAAVIRSIYHYHTHGNGWCDIGYNFIVDRYGRVYEGRYGGIARPVLGAQAQGFNWQSTGVALLGTDTLSSEARSALVKLLAWKLDWHQIDPTAQIQVTSNGSDKYPEGTVVTVNTISGHRDVYLTACPGEAIYGQLPQIRNDVAAEIAKFPPMVKIDQSGGATNVAEGGKTDSYTIALGQAPAALATVTIAIHPDSQVTVNPSQLSFTSSNSSTPQIVVVSAVDDTLSEPTPHFGMITHTSSSTDSNFNAISIRYVEPLITDNEAKLGGELTSGPDVSSWGKERLDVFARGTDNALWHKWFNGSWLGWEPQGGALTSDPSAVSWGSGRIDVFARGTDNALWHKWFNGSWSSWESLGGKLTSGPDAASWGPGRLDVFARGTDNQLWHRWFDGTWHAWEPLGGVLTSDPSAVSWGSGRIDVFVRGTDNGLWHRYFANGKWAGWEPLGGSFSSSPDVSSWAPGRLDVFVQGDDATLQHRWFDGNWSGWEGLGGTLTSDPAAASWAPGRVDVFARTTGDVLWHKWWDGSRWRQE
jgi:N-acetylmuramoyl-L-alanine amidase-like protein/repeat uncharacterized protein DUF346